MENRNGKRVISYGLVGRLFNVNMSFPLKKGHVYTPEQIWKSEVEGMLKNAKTYEDLNALGEKFNMAIDNKYNICIWDYQVQASKKMREIYNKTKVEVEN